MSTNNVGQAAAILNQQDAPTRTDVIWGYVADPGFPQIVILRYWDDIGGQWVDLADATGSYLRKPVIRVDLNTPPVSPSVGDRYLIASGGTGAWSGKDDELAEWRGSAWAFEAPIDGWMLISRADANILYDYRTGTGWTANDFNNTIDPSLYVLKATAGVPLGFADLDVNGFVPQSYIDSDNLVYNPGAPGNWPGGTDTFKAALDHLILTVGAGGDGAFLAAGDTTISPNSPINLTQSSGDEVAFNSDFIVNKAADSYTAYRVNVTETAAPGANNKFLDFQVGGSTRFEVLSNGRIMSSAYGGGGVTGTATYNLAVDMNGNIIETALVGGGSVSFGAENEIPTTNSTTDDFDYSSDFTFSNLLFVNTNSTNTNITQDVLKLKAQTSVDMTDNFGGNIILNIEDDTSGDQETARIYWDRGALDNRGSFGIDVWQTSAYSNFLNVVSSSWVTFTGVSANSFRFQDFNTSNNILTLTSTDTIFYEDDGTTELARFERDNGTVRLYYQGTESLRTTTGGQILIDSGIEIGSTAISQTLNASGLSFNTKATTGQQAYRFWNSNAFSSSSIDQAFFVLDDNGQAGIDIDQTGTATFKGIKMEIDDIGSSSSGVLDGIFINYKDGSRTGDKNFIRGQNDGVDVFRVDTDGRIIASVDGASSAAGNILTISGTNQPNTRTMYLGTDNTEVYFDTAADHDMSFRTNGSERFAVSSSGFVLNINGSAGSPAWKWAADSDTGFYYGGIPGDVRLSTGSALTQQWNTTDTIFYEDDGSTVMVQLERDTGKKAFVNNVTVQAVLGTDSVQLRNLALESFTTGSFFITGNNSAPHSNYFTINNNGSWTSTSDQSLLRLLPSSINKSTSGDADILFIDAPVPTAIVGNYNLIKANYNSTTVFRVDSDGDVIISDTAAFGWGIPGDVTFQGITRGGNNEILLVPRNSHSNYVSITSSGTQEFTIGTASSSHTIRLDSGGEGFEVLGGTNTLNAYTSNLTAQQWNDTDIIFYEDDGTTEMARFQRDLGSILFNSNTSELTSSSFLTKTGGTYFTFNSGSTAANRGFTHIVDARGMTAPAYVFTNSAGSGTEFNSADALQEFIQYSSQMNQTGTASMNFFDIQIDDNSSASGEFNMLRIDYQNAGSTRSGDINFINLQDDGVSLFKVDSTGQIQSTAYGSGTVTGTATYALAVDAAGNIIETALGGGGGWALTGETNLTGNVIIDTSAASRSIVFQTNNFDAFEIFDNGVNIVADDGTTTLFTVARDTGNITLGGGNDTVNIGTSATTLNQINMWANFGAISATRRESSTSGFQTVLNINRETTGVGTSAGYGSVIDIGLDTSTGVVESALQIRSTWQTATNAAESSEVDVLVKDDGSDINILSFGGDRDISGLPYFHWKLQDRQFSFINDMIIDFENSGRALFIQNNQSSASNSVNYLTYWTRQSSSGTPAAGYGIGLALRMDNANSTFVNGDALRISTEWNDATNGSEDSRATLEGMVAGTSQSTFAIFNADGNQGITLGSDTNQTIISKKVTLTQGQIQGLNTTPITAISAPGAGKYVDIISASAYLDYNGTAYSGASGVIRLQIAGGSGKRIDSGSFITNSADSVESVAGQTFSSIPLNTAWELTATNDFTGAGGTIAVSIVYAIITV